MAVLRLGPQRRAGHGDVDADGYRQAQRCRSQAWLADLLDRIAETPQSQLEELLPWNWVPEKKLDRAA